jgi:hypothetical protein
VEREVALKERSISMLQKEKELLKQQMEVAQDNSIF